MSAAGVGNRRLFLSCRPSRTAGKQVTVRGWLAGRLRKWLKAASTLPEAARLAPFANFLLQTTKLYAESVAHTSPGVRRRRNPGEAPTRNSTLKACHIADTKNGFHCQAIGNGQLSMSDRLQHFPFFRRSLLAQCTTAAIVVARSQKMFRQLRAPGW